MGQLAFLKMFLIVSIPTDINDNRRHVHIFKKGVGIFVLSQKYGSNEMD